MRRDVPGRARIEPCRTRSTSPGTTRPTELIAAEPLALLIGFVLDQQVTVPTAFAGPLKLKQRLGGLDAAEIAGIDPDRLAGGLPREARRSTASRATWPSACRSMCAVVAEEYDGDASRVWRDATDTADLKRRIEALPGFGEMKVKALASVLARRYGNAMAEPLVPNHPMLGDVDSPEALAEYQAAKRAYKASLRAAAGVIELRFYRDGGQSAVDVAHQVAEFLGAAQTSLELALYDIRLHDEAAEIVTGALRRRAGARRRRPARLQRRPPRADPGAAAAADRTGAARGAADPDARRSPASPT